MEERGKIPPGLPRPNPTVSYWQDPPSNIASFCSSSSLPSKADYVVIGSGISGTSIAHSLLEKKPNASVVMLEAREACSGATGRNGGHTKAASYRSFLSHEEHYGLEEAIKIARLEYANIEATHASAKKYSIDCASNPCDTIDIIYSRGHLEAGHKAIARMQETMGASDPAAAYRTYSAHEAAKTSLAPDALGAFSYPAGSLSAYLFTTGLLKRAISLGLQLYTNTPATSIENASTAGSPPQWTVSTPRGPITTPCLILATNGYTPHLLPSTQGLIVPLRGQISAQRPGSGIPRPNSTGTEGLQTTYSFIYDTGYEYMIPRPAGTPDAGTIIIGGGLGTLANDGASEFGETDDTKINPELSDYLTECTQRYFGRNWGSDSEEGRVKKEWSGIMGTSADGLPYVGEVPGMEGVWLSASFNGHGMVLCLKCAEALVGMVVEGVVEEWFPKSMLMSEKRFGRKFVGRLGMKAPGEEVFGDRGEACGKL